jgi:hypothetical protein
MSDRGWTIFKRKKDRRTFFVLKYKDLNEWRQKSIPEEVRTEAEAEVWADGWLGARAANGSAPVVRREAGPTPRDIHQRWIQLRKDAKEDGKPRFKPSTISDNESHLKLEILPAFGDTPCSRLELQDLRGWIRKLRGKLSAYRVLNIVSTFRTMVDDAMGEGWVKLPANPLKHPAVTKELPARKAKSGPIPVFVELEHLRKVLACDDVPDHRRVRWLVLGTTGIDDGELAGRIWTDADLGTKPTLRIHTVLATRGEDGWASMGSTKNEYRARTIPLHRAAAEALRWWHAEGWAMYVGRPPRHNDPIFPSASGKAARPKSAAQLRQDLRAAGCPDKQHGARIDAKALRRSFSTWLDAAGVHQEQRGRLMGHRPTTVTAKHYTAAQVETDRDAVNRIDLDFVVPNLVSGLVPATPNEAYPQSHLRDLNSRPTVYENGGSWCRARSDGVESVSLRPTVAGSANGKPDTNGALHHGVVGAATTGEVPRELADLRTSLAALSSGWDRLDAFLGEADLGGEGGSR